MQKCKLPIPTALLRARTEFELPFRQRYTVFAVCPQNCLLSSIGGVWAVAHTLPPDVHIGGLLPFQKVCTDPCVPERGSHSPSAAASPPALVKASQAACPQALVRKLRVYNRA